RTGSWTSSLRSPSAALADAREGGLAARVSRDGLASLVDLAHLDELEAERLDVLQHAVQRRLILDRSGENRLHRLDLGVETLEAREQPLAQPTSDAKLVTAGLHPVTVEPLRVTTPHPL